jgi:hypothetical protein
VDPDAVDGYYYVDDDDEGLSASERNIVANGNAGREEEGPQRKSPKLSERGRGVNASGRVRDDGEAVTALVVPYKDKDINGADYPTDAEDIPTVEHQSAIKPLPPTTTTQAADGKENITAPSPLPPSVVQKQPPPTANPHIATGAGIPVRPAVKKVAEKSKAGNTGSTGKGSKGRVGLRRL